MTLTLLLDLPSTSILFLSATFTPAADLTTGLSLVLVFILVRILVLVFILVCDLVFVFNPIFSLTLLELFDTDLSSDVALFFKVTLFNVTSAFILFLEPRSTCDFTFNTGFILSLRSSLFFTSTPFTLTSNLFLDTIFCLLSTTLDLLVPERFNPKTSLSTTCRIFSNFLICAPNPPILPKLFIFKLSFDLFFSFDLSESFNLLFSFDLSVSFDLSISTTPSVTSAITDSSDNLSEGLDTPNNSESSNSKESSAPSSKIDLSDFLEFPIAPNIPNGVSFVFLCNCIKLFTSLSFFSISTILLTTENLVSIFSTRELTSKRVLFISSTRELISDFSRVRSIKDICFFNKII